MLVLSFKKLQEWLPNETGDQLSVSGQTMGIETVNCAVHIKNSTVNITSENRTYKAYTAAPAAKGNYPAIVLIHSFKGFEPGYKKMVDRMAADGYIVIAPFWGTILTLRLMQRWKPLSETV